jgi:hypothetical protein
MGTWCEDPWLKEVRSWGYVPVLLPKTGLAPLRVLKRRGKELNDIGSLLDLFVPGDVAAPKPGPEQKSANRGRVQSGKLKMGLGVHFLHGALEVLGVSGAVRAEHRGAKSLRFTAEDIGISKVDLVPLDRFLAAADIVADAPTAAQLLTSEEAFICTEVVVAHALTVEMESSRDDSAGVPPLPVHPGVSVGGEVTAGAAGTSHLRYRGDRAVVFGLKAAQIRFSDGQYRCLADPPGGLKVKGPPKPTLAKWLETDAPFLGVGPT